MFLSSDDRRQLQRASEVMLHPLDAHSPIEFLKAVAAEVLPLLGGFAAICGTRDPQGNLAVASDQWPAQVVQLYAEWKLRDAGTERALGAGLEVAMMRQVVGSDWALYHADPMVQAWYKPNGVLDAGAYLLHWPEDDTLASIEFHAQTFGTARFGEEGEALLQLMLPSLKAGMRVLYLLGRNRAQLLRELTIAGAAVCVFSRGGKLLQTSETLRVLVPDPASSDLLMAQAGALVRRIAPAQATALRGGGEWPLRTQEIAETPHGKFRLSAALAAADLGFGATDVIVAIERLGHVAVRAEELTRRFHLTRRETDVALLLRQGLRNDIIATILAISPHTVRRHTEQILAKLSVTSRSEAVALLQSRT